MSEMRKLMNLCEGKISVLSLGNPEKELNGKQLSDIADKYDWSDVTPIIDKSNLDTKIVGIAYDGDASDTHFKGVKYTDLGMEEINGVQAYII